MGKNLYLQKRFCKLRTDIAILTSVKIKDDIKNENLRRDLALSMK